MEIRVRNVHRALPEALFKLRLHGVKRESRNGEVIVIQQPVLTTYDRPLERVIFWSLRDANPFFHLMEALWMLGGRRDVAFPSFFVPRMAAYSDDGVTFHGAYGFRWRHWFNFDQIKEAVQLLRDDPDTRRCVIQIWDATDLDRRESKDLPCNTQVYFSIVDGFLNMTVCNRSNDIVWGAYGANAVHFSILQEYVATAVGATVGQYHQFSNNLHAYPKTLRPIMELADLCPDVWAFREEKWCPYSDGRVKPYPLIQTPMAQWTQELEMFLDEGPVMGMKDPFFRKVAGPMLQAYQEYRAVNTIDRYEKAMEKLEPCAAEDWKVAGMEWLQRRLDKHKTANDDGVVYD